MYQSYASTPSTDFMNRHQLPAVISCIAVAKNIWHKFPVILGQPMFAFMNLDCFDVLKVKLFRKVRNHLHYQTVLRSAVNKYVNDNKTDVLKENMMAQATVLHQV